MSHLAEARSQHAEGENQARSNVTSRWNPFEDPSDPRFGSLAGREAPRHPKWDPSSLKDFRERLRFNESSFEESVQPAPPAPTPQTTYLRGTAAELRRRHEEAQASSSSSQPEPEENILDAFAKQPVDKRLAGLEEYVYMRQLLFL